MINHVIVYVPAWDTRRGRYRLQRRPHTGEILDRIRFRSQSGRSARRHETLGRRHDHYQQDGNTVTVTGSVDDQTPGPLCSLAFMTEYKALMQKALANVKAQVIYQ
ncbi:MAG: hypothetical protein LBH31_07085 [Burkholderiaceae bacterium]|jgi:hypothetical protein|nr:hypothetical protein [Burkholderiaceae bacterium]